MDATAIPKDKFHLFLLAGQSNMAGRGHMTEADRIPSPDVLMFDRNCQWVPAVDPVHFDKKEAGTGLCRSFASIVAAAHPGTVIGLIPCACGGSPISTWEPGAYHDQTDSHPYDDTIRRTRLAMQSGILKGILWHQGEGDCEEENAPLYEKRLRCLIERLRKELNAPEVPLIIGQLGNIPERPWTEYTEIVNKAHLAAASEPNCAFVKSDGLTCNEDHLHFNAASLKEFGRRYAETYLKLSSNI